MHDFQIPIVMPRPIEPPPLPNRQALIRPINPLMPTPLPLQLDNPLLDKQPLPLLRIRQFGPVLGPKGRRLEQPVAAHDAADLLERVRDLVHEPFGPAALDEARDFLLEPVVQRERVDDRGLAAGAGGRLAEED